MCKLHQGISSSFCPLVVLSYGISGRYMELEEKNLLLTSTTMKDGTKWNEWAEWGVSQGKHLLYFVRYYQYTAVINSKPATNTPLWPHHNTLGYSLSRSIRPVTTLSLTWLPEVLYCSLPQWTQTQFFVHVWNNDSLPPDHYQCWVKPNK